MKHKLSAASYMALAALPLANVATKMYAQEKKQPNILWILTDDERADALSCYNKATRGTAESALGHVSSPFTDQLAAEGTLFTNAYCNNPGSAPSRASMHTGMYSHHSSLYGFEYWHDGVENPVKMLPHLMAAKGYQTARFGKLGVRRKHWVAEGKRTKSQDIYQTKVDYGQLEEAGSTDWGKKPVWGKKKGKEVLFKYPDKEVRIFFPAKGKMDAKNKVLFDQVVKDQDHLYKNPDGSSMAIIGGVSTMPTMGTLDGEITQAFCAFLDNKNKKYKTSANTRVQGAQTDKPIFVHLGHHFAHTPLIPSKSFRDKFAGQKYKEPAFDNRDFKNMPPMMKEWYKKSNMESLTHEQMQQVIRDYYAFAAMGDSLVGISVRKFKEYSKQQGRPWVIVYACGDHGWHLGEQNATGKFAPFVKSNKTVLIVASSDKNLVPRGKVVKDITEYVDIAPTCLAQAGYDLSKKEWEYLDGYNLVDVANGKTTPREYTLTQQNQVMGPWASLRSKDFMASMRIRKYRAKAGMKLKPQEAEEAGMKVLTPNHDVMWAMNAPLKNVEFILYDLRNDPNERFNVADKPKYKKLAEFLRKKMCNIYLGDDRLEVDWTKKNVYDISNFASGSDDKKLRIPKNIVPKI